MSKKDKIIRPFVITKDPMIQDLLRKFSERSDKGISDYKVTMYKLQNLLLNGLKMPKKNFGMVLFIQKKSNHS